MNPLLLLTLTFTLLTLLPSIHAASPPNPRPIIGILTLAASDNPSETKSEIPAGYVKFLEQSGARVVPIPFNLPTDKLDSLFDSM